MSNLIDKNKSHVTYKTYPDGSFKAAYYDYEKITTGQNIKNAFSQGKKILADNRIDISHYAKTWADFPNEANPKASIDQTILRNNIPVDTYLYIGIEVVHILIETWALKNFITKINCTGVQRYILEEYFRCPVIILKEKTNVTRMYFSIHNLVQSKVPLNRSIDIKLPYSRRKGKQNSPDKLVYGSNIGKHNFYYVLITLAKSFNDGMGYNAPKDLVVSLSSMISSYVDSDPKLLNNLKRFNVISCKRIRSESEFTFDKNRLTYALKNGDHHVAWFVEN